MGRKDDWYMAVRKGLDKPPFEIRKSRFQSRNSIYDVRLQRGGVAPRIRHCPRSVRIIAERSLHSLYKRSSSACRSGKCSTTSITSVFITVKQSGGNWTFSCNGSELRLGLCGNPIIHNLAEQLQAAIRESKLLHPSSKGIGIHIAWTFIPDVGPVSTHANTFLFEASTKQTWLFEPQGTIERMGGIPNAIGLKQTIQSSLTDVSKRIGYRYNGYLTPDCNFQDDNQELCYLWTTWLEFLVVLNPTCKIRELAEYIQYRYTSFHRRGISRRHIVTQFTHYLASV